MHQRFLALSCVFLCTLSACSSDDQADTDTDTVITTETSTGDGDGDPAGDGDGDPIGDGDGDPIGDGDGDPIGDGDGDPIGDGDGDPIGDGDGDPIGDAEGYGDCATALEEEACLMDEVCFADGEPVGNAICGLPCESVDDCPAAPATGNPTVSCTDLTVDDVSECILGCDNGETCPDGMACFADLLCMWPAF